jgi:hypothetical protein
VVALLEVEQRRGLLAGIGRRLGAAQDDEILVIDRVLIALERGRGGDDEPVADAAIMSLAQLARATVAHTAKQRAKLEQEAAAELAEHSSRAREWGVADHVTRASSLPQRMAHEHDAAPYAAINIDEDDRTP